MTKKQKIALKDLKDSIKVKKTEPKITVKPSVKARLEAEAKALEAQIAQDKADARQGLNLDLTTRSLLDAAIDACVKNNGQNIPDPVGAAKVRFHSELLAACNGNLGDAIVALMGSPNEDDLTKIDRRPTRVFSLLNAVMKSAMFLANGRYQMWLNGKDQPLFAQRDELKPAPYGLQFTSDAFIDAQLANAIHQLQAWFGGLLEMLGYPGGPKTVLVDGVEEQVSPAPFIFPLGWKTDIVNGIEQIVPITDLDEAYASIQQKEIDRKRKRIETENKVRMDAIKLALHNMKKDLAKAA